MKSLHLLIGLISALILGALSPLPLQRVQAAAGPALVVVIATTTGVRDITTAILRRAFMGYPTEVGGKRLIPINHPTGSPNRVMFDQLMLGLSPDEVGRFWVDRRIRDESPPPKTVPSPDLAVRVAASLPFAITYITPDLVNDKVAVLTIDGKSPKDGSYLLK
jgi:hypothetical protein